MRDLKSFILSFIAIICIAIFGSVFTSCTNDDEELVPHESTMTDKGVQEMTDYLIANYGFDMNSIRQDDSLLIAEGDIMFNINDFWRKYSIHDAITRTHYASSPIVSSSHRRILVRAPQSGEDYELPTSWLTALVYGVQAWNNLGGPIYFTLWSGDTYTDIIEVKYLGFVNSPGTIAMAPFPSGGSPGSLILINSNYYNINAMTLSNKTATMIHELGHTIGFAHTDETPSTNSVSALNTSDYNSQDNLSVMLQNTFPNNPNYFSTYDIEAYHLLYNW